jgi:hypothetical protein
VSLCPLHHVLSHAYDQSEARIIYVFYRHSRETNKFLQSNGSISRPRYFRILAVACVDILLVLPLGVLSVASQVIGGPRETFPGFPSPFYLGWTAVHTNWGPVAIPYSTLVRLGSWTVFRWYFQFWTTPVLAFAIFALVGLTSEARATYWGGICAVRKGFGWTPPVSKQGEAQLGAQRLTGMVL